MSFGDGMEIGSRANAPDFELVREFVSGEAAAFDRLYERHSTCVYNTCLGILGNPDDARDAMQDTFVQVYRSLPKFRGQSGFSTWLYRITVNKCMDMIQSRPKWEQADSIEFPGEEDPVGDPLLEEHVRRTILRLKAEFRVVLVLYYFQQLSYEEIAESLGWSLNQVRIRLHRGRKAFRLIYGGNEDEVQADI